MLVKIRSDLFFLFLLVIFNWAIPVLANNVPILPFSKVEIGMKGYGKTVFEGTKISTFSVEVLGKFVESRLEDQFFFPGRGILIRVYGKEIENAGGVSAGMSGSPVYLGRKIIGGISASWNGTDKKSGFLALVTPIEDILKLGKYYKGKYETGMIINFPFKWKGNNYQGIILGNKFAQKKYLNFSYISTPVISNLKGDFFSFFPRKEVISANKDVFKLYQRNRILSELSQKYGKTPLKEGSAFAVQFVRGDYTVTVLGTVTYIDNNKIYGLAHSILKKGSVEYFLSNAYIYTTIKGEENPYRLGVALKPVGSVVEDRSQGILGIKDYFPRIIPVEFKIEDLDLKEEKKYIVQIVRYKDLFINFFRSSLRQSLEDTINRVGAGTVKATMKVRYLLKGERDIQTISFKWFYYRDSDYSEKLVNEAPDILLKLMNNRFKKLELVDVKILVKVEQRNLKSQLEKMELFEKKGKLCLKVAFRPYQEELKYKVFPLSKITSGKYHFVVQVAKRKQKDVLSEDSYRDFSEFIKGLHSDYQINILEILGFKEGEDKEEPDYRKVVKVEDYLLDGLLEKDFMLEQD